MSRRDTPSVRRLVVLLVVVVLAACSGGSPVSGSKSTTTATTQLSGPTVSSPTGPLVAALPEGCAATTPDPRAVVTFVAGGRGWAVAPDDASTLTCLFEVGDAGIFSWGPQGDRVVLAGLEVRGVGADVSRPPANLHPSYFSWSRPTGTTVVFSDQRQRTISRADLGSSGTRDITPLPDKTFGDIAYHPSGLAIAFVAKASDGTPSIWISTNNGENAELLLQAAGPETAFEHIVFSDNGSGLYYTLDRGDTHTVERLDLVTGGVEEIASFDAPVHEILETRGLPLAFTVGATCADRTVTTQLTLGAGAVLHPVAISAPGPVSAVGWLDAGRLIVAAGGCDAPSDLYLVQITNGEATPLVRAADAVAMRTPAPDPPPPLPDRLPQSGFA
jgi:hypothetical protein